MVPTNCPALLEGQVQGCERELEAGAAGPFVKGGLTESESLCDRVLLKGRKKVCVSESSLCLEAWGTGGAVTQTRETAFN